jgi:hypothetical protein
MTLRWSRRLGIASLLLVCLLCVRGAAQTSASPNAKFKSLFNKSPVDRLVDQLIENAALFRATLPSLTAHETIESDASNGWPFKSHGKAEATMRVMRKTPDGPLEESRQITVFDGKPVKAGRHVELPTMLLGGFGALAEVFFTQDRRHCFDYILIPRDKGDGMLELHITHNPEASSFSNCPIHFERVSATALVDSETRQLTHLEFTIPDEDAVPYHRWPFASVDLAPIEVGDKTFWLPTTVIGRVVRGKERENWIAHYSDYHRFAATANIVPASP